MGLWDGHNAGDPKALEDAMRNFKPMSPEEFKRWRTPCGRFWTEVNSLYGVFVRASRDG